MSRRLTQAHYICCEGRLFIPWHILVLLTTPTGPKPMTASVNFVSIASKRSDSSLPKKVAGYGLPVIMGKTFGCWIACNAANAPVGRISANSSSELSAIPSRAVFGTLPGHSSGLLRLKSVPPALGTRTYCACPPGNFGMPKSVDTTHRQVNPTRQKLSYKFSIRISFVIDAFDSLTLSTRYCKRGYNSVPNAQCRIELWAV